MVSTFVLVVGSLGRGLLGLAEWETEVFETGDLGLRGRSFCGE